MSAEIQEINSNGILVHHDVTITIGTGSTTVYGNDFLIQAHGPLPSDDGDSLLNPSYTLVIILVSVGAIAAVGVAVGFYVKKHPKAPKPQWNFDKMEPSIGNVQKKPSFTQPPNNNNPFSDAGNKKDPFADVLKKKDPFDGWNN